MTPLIDRISRSAARNYSAGTPAGRPRLTGTFDPGDCPGRLTAAIRRSLVGKWNGRFAEPRIGSAFGRPAADKFFDDGEKFTQHDRLRDIAVAAAVERPALVARHCKGGHRDHRNRLGLRVSLELAH